jgi:hypothetical protein
VAVQKPETIFDIADLFTQLNEAFTTSAVKLRETFAQPEWADSPFVYHMPKMHLSMRLVLSHSDGKVKGFFNKESTETQQEVTSTVEIDVVAVPRS